MTKIMIADDEKISIDSLRFIIEKHVPDAEIISTARSGREAIEKVEENPPDILFMDIRMPGINGIEAIREIRKKHADIKIIVLTAFDQFEFAKDAVNLGVMEYLLKPANRSKVIEAIERAKETLRISRAKRQAELEMKEKLEYAGPILENGFVYSMLQFDYNSKELIEYKQILNIQEDGGYVMTVELLDLEKPQSLQAGIGLGIKSQQFYPVFTDVAKSMADCIIGPIMRNRIVVIVPKDVDTEEFQCRQDAIDLAEMIVKRLREKSEIPMKIGIGRVYRRFDMLAASYEESLKALRYLNETGTMHFTDIVTRSNEPGAEYPEYKEKVLLQKVSSGDLAESISAFVCIFDWLVREYEMYPLKIKNKLLELMYLVNHMSWEYEPGRMSEGTGFLEEMLAINDLPELQSWCKSTIEKVISQVITYRNIKVSSLTKRTKEYIKANYAKPITLEEIAREINVSPQYLSKLFKEETGENFIDYLTATRIRIAKQLLEQDELSVKEICYNTGYSDPNYFSRIFKKVVGVTPTEYKEGITG